MRQRKPVRERFEAKVGQRGEGCWEWTGSRSAATGYGMFALRHPDGTWKPTTAHRVAHDLYIGPVPSGLVVDHLCRNRGCVNPAHLEAVTQRTNVLRGEHPSAVAIRTGRCKRGHDLSPGRDCTRCQSARRGEPSPRPTLEERIAAKTETAGTGCRIWTGARISVEYGAIRVGGRTLLAHRAAYELANGPIPLGATVRHICGNRACVEPAHLVLAEASRTRGR